MSDLTSWLSELGLSKYVDAFDEAEIDFAMLADLTEDDLKELGQPIGPRRKVWGGDIPSGSGRGCTRAANGSNHRFNACG